MPRPRSLPSLRTILPPALALGFFLATLAPLASPLAADVVDRVVLRVNDRIATLVDYERRRGEALAQIRQSDMAEAEKQQLLSELGSRVFRDLFEELLLASRADQLRIYPTETQIDEALDGVLENFGIESEDELAAGLAQQGLSLAEFRQQLREQLRVREVIGREVTSQIEIEEDDLRRYYRANEDLFVVPARRQVRSLVVLEEGTSDPGQLAELAADIRRQLQAGTPLDEVAAAYEASGETSSVIDLGWIEAGQLDPALEAALDGMPVGEYSEPVEARGGLHILHQVGFEEERLQPFADVAEDIAGRLRNQRFSEAMETYMRDLERRAYVEAEPPPGAADFRTVAGSRSQSDDFELVLPSGEPLEVDAPDAPASERDRPPGR